MGRFYDGSISGKFWFGVQSSNDAEFFGVEGTQNFLNFYFEERDLPEIKEGIKTCNKKLKPYKTKLKNFFKEKKGYNNEQLITALDLKDEENATGKVAILLEWYARLELGEKILKCVKEEGYCDFEAEL